MEDEKPTLRQRIKNSKVLAVGIVWATLTLDFLLYSSVVPIIPKYIDASVEVADVNATNKANFTQENFTNASDSGTCEFASGKSIAQQDAENRLVGVFLAVKQGVQIVMNIFVGPVIDHIGYDVPLFSGYIIIIISSMGFAFGEGRTILFVVRGLQGVGSAFVSTSSMTLIADKFQDDEERGKMFGIALCGISLGLLAGPSYGAILYQFWGKAAPFIGMALMALIFAGLQLLLRLPKIRLREKSSGKMSHIKVMGDYQVLMTGLAVVLSNVGIGFLQGVLPLYMLRTFCAEEWAMGAVFLPTDGSYFIGVIFYGWMSKFFGRLNLIVVSRIIASAAFAIYPFCTNLQQLFGPGVIIGMPSAILNASMYQATAYVVDKNLKEALYGGAYAISNTSFCLAYGAGPLIGGLLVPHIGFDGTMYVAVATSIFALIPVVLLRDALRATNGEGNEGTPLLEENHTPKLIPNGVNGSVITTHHEDGP